MVGNAFHYSMTRAVMASYEAPGRQRSQVHSVSLHGKEEEVPWAIPDQEKKLAAMTQGQLEEWIKERLRKANFQFPSIKLKLKDGRDLPYQVPKIIPGLVHVHT